MMLDGHKWVKAAIGLAKIIILLLSPANNSVTSDIQLKTSKSQLEFSPKLFPLNSLKISIKAIFCFRTRTHSKWKIKSINTHINFYLILPFLASLRNYLAHNYKFFPFVNLEIPHEFKFLLLFSIASATTASVNEWISQSVGNSSHSSLTIMEKRLYTM
jgi:hypothetical protein